MPVQDVVAPKQVGHWGKEEVTMKDFEAKEYKVFDIFNNG